MIRMIIADDERLIRESLHQLIEWEKYGVEVVATANNGKVALQQTLELMPDILLSDINMPEMSGVELIQALSEAHSPCKVIFLSAYSDFAYAQSAIRFGVYDYILKPIDEEQLIQTVLSCAQSILSARQFDKKIQSADLAESLLINNTLRDFLVNPSQISSAQRALLNRIGLNYDAGTIFNAMSISMPLKELEKYLPKAPEFQLFFIDFAPDKTVILWKVEENEKYLHSGTLFNLQAYISPLCQYSNELLKNLSSPVSICIGTPHTIESVYKLYFECSFASLAPYFGIEDSIIVFDKIKRLCYRSSMPDKLPELLPVLTNGTAAEIDKYLQQVFLYLLHTDNIYQLSKIQLHCIALLDELGKIHNPFSLSQDEWESDFMITLKVPITEAKSIAEIYQVMRQILLRLSGNTTESSSQNRLVRQTLHYIHQNYANASLQQAAAQIYVSSTYLSRIFANEMNESFSRYLLRCRIQKAKELMQDPKLKLYEIAMSVGYADISHFSKAFKQIEGCSPQNYRNQC